MSKLNSGKKCFTNPLVWKEGQERISLYSRTYFVCCSIVVFGCYAWLRCWYLRAFETIAGCVNVNISAKDFNNVKYSSININKRNIAKLCIGVLIPPEPPPETIIKNGFEYDHKKRNGHRYVVSQTADEDEVLI